MLRCVADSEREPMRDWWRGSSSELPEGSSTGCSAGWDCLLSAGLRMAGPVPKRRQLGSEHSSSCLLSFSSRSFSSLPSFLLSFFIFGGFIMTAIVGILALIGLAVVGAIGWAFAQGVRDGLAQWRGAPPGGTSQPVPVGEPPLSLSAALPSSYQAGQLAGEVAASWHSAHRAARTAGAGAPASSSWAAALALGSELSQQRQEAGRAMQAAMAQVLQDNEQAVRAAASGGRDASSGSGVTDESSGNGASGSGASPESEPDGSDSGNSGQSAAGTAHPTWPSHSPSRRPPQPRPRRCTQQRPARSDERQP